VASAPHYLYHTYHGHCRTADKNKSKLSGQKHRDKLPSIGGMCYNILTTYSLNKYNKSAEMKILTHIIKSIQINGTGRKCERVYNVYVQIEELSIVDIGQF